MTTTIMTMNDWEGYLQRQFDTMPSWYWNSSMRKKRYEAYVTAKKAQRSSERSARSQAADDTSQT